MREMVQYRGNKIPEWSDIPSATTPYGRAQGPACVPSPDRPITGSRRVGRLRDY